MQANDNKQDAITQAEYAIWKTERAWLLSDIQTMRNMLAALRTGLEHQRLDRAQRHDWMYAIDFVMNEVCDPGDTPADDNDAETGVAA